MIREMIREYMLKVISGIVPSELVVSFALGSGYKIVDNNENVRWQNLWNRFYTRILQSVDNNSPDILMEVNGVGLHTDEGVFVDRIRTYQANYKFEIEELSCNNLTLKISYELQQVKSCTWQGKKIISDAMVYAKIETIRC